jgi:hypothetical protein
MKLLNASALIVLCSIFTASSFAQNTTAKQKLFAAYPENISLNKIFITDVFSYNTGSSVSIELASNFHFAGTVISNQQKYDNLQTIMIRSSENNHSIFQISKITNNDKSATYAGCIINSDAADGYIIKNINGIYSLQKFESDKILEHCN